MHHIRSRKPGLAIGVALSAMLAVPAVPAVPAVAQDYDESQEIKVTGQIQTFRGDLTLRALPQATQEISVAQLQQLNITRFADALDLSASVSRQNGFGGLYDAYAIRGFAGDPNSPSGVLVNGFNGGRGNGGPRDASSIDKIEILRGPTSALFGRGEPGGTVNIVTKKPLFTPQGSVNATIGRFNNYRGEVDLTGPINDVVAVRVTGAIEDADSFRDTVHTKKYVATPSVMLKLPDTIATYEVELMKQEVPLDRGIVAINGDPFVLPRSRFLGEPEDGNNTLRAIGQQLQVQQDLAGSWKLIVAAMYRWTHLSGIGQDPEFTANRNPLTYDLTNLSRRRIDRDMRSKDFIPRIELSGRLHTGPLTHHILLGADYEWLHMSDVRTRFRPAVITSAQLANRPFPSSLLFALNAINIYDPVYQTAAQQATIPMPIFRDQAETHYAKGVYFRDQVDVTDWLKVLGGIRYDHYKQSLTNHLTGAVARQKLEQWSPSFGIGIDPVRGLTIYGSYSKGFRANTGANIRNESFQPERTTSKEVGAKFDLWGKNLTGTVALYDMKKSNIITADPVNAGFSIDVGEAKSRGVELDLNARIPGGINMALSYAYTDAYVTTAILDPDFGRTINAGDPLINIPKNTVSFVASKDVLIGEHKLNFGGQVRYVGKRLGETGTKYMLPDYTLVRVFASAEVTDRIKVSATVNNLFGVHYFPASYAALWTMPGAPREWSLRVGYSF